MVNKKNLLNTLFFFPLKKEKELFLKSFPNLQNKSFIIGLGKVEAAISCVQIISDFISMNKETPNIIIIGGSGQFTNTDSNKVKVIEKVIEYDYKSQFKLKTKNPFPIHKIKNQELINFIKNIDSDLSFVNCASADQDLISNSQREEVQKLTSADIVTWESAGIFRALNKLNVPFAEIRFTTDLADTSLSIEDYLKNLEAKIKTFKHTPLGKFLTENI